MAKVKEAKATYTVEPITVVTARGQTEIPRALRERYRVTAKSRLRWTDTGEGLLIVPLNEPALSKNRKRMTHSPDASPASPLAQVAPNIRPENREAIAVLRAWMQEPDDWTPEQWDEFEHELRTRRLRFRDIEL